MTKCPGRVPNASNYRSLPIELSSPHALNHQCANADADAADSLAFTTRTCSIAAARPQLSTREVEHCCIVTRILALHYCHVRWREFACKEVPAQVLVYCTVCADTYCGRFSMTSLAARHSSRLKSWRLRGAPVPRALQSALELLSTSALAQRSNSNEPLERVCLIEFSL